MKKIHFIILVLLFSYSYSYSQTINLNLVEEIKQSTIPEFKEIDLTKYKLYIYKDYKFYMELNSPKVLNFNFTPGIEKFEIYLIYNNDYCTKVDFFKTDLIKDSENTKIWLNWGYELKKLSEAEKEKLNILKQKFFATLKFNEKPSSTYVTSFMIIKTMNNLRRCGLQNNEDNINKTTTNSNNTNLKFYLTDTKKTPVSLTTLNFISTNDIPSFKFLKNIGNNDKTDNYGNYSLSEQLISKTDLKKSWSLIINPTKNLDTVTTIVVFDKDENKEYFLKKDSTNHFVFDFGREPNIKAEENKTINNKNSSNSINYKFVTNDAKQKPIVNNIAYVKTGNLENTKRVTEIFLKLPYKTSFLQAGFNSQTTNNFGNLDKSFPDKKVDLYSLIVLEKSKQIDTLDEILVIDRLKNTKTVIKKDTSGYFVFNNSLQTQKETVKPNETIYQNTNLKFYLLTENNKAISNVKVVYNDYRSKTINSNSITNADGLIELIDISSENELTILVPWSEKLNSTKKIIIVDQNKNIIKELTKTPEGTFKYTFLPNELTVLPEIENTDTQLNIVKSTELKLTEAETQKPISNQKVIYNDANGKKQNTSTNNDGVFKVENISEKNFVIELEKSENLNSINSIRVSNKQGVTITEIKKNNQSSFEYTFLPSDFINLTEITNDGLSLNTIKSIELKLTDTETKKPISNQKVIYNDVEGKKQNTSTNNNGIFTVKNASTENLQIELENNDKLKSILKISISTKQGDKISEMQKSPEGTFKYTFLKSELSVLKELSNNDDIALKINTFKNNDNNELKIKKQIYFDLASAELSNNAKTELDAISQILNENPTLQLEIIAHTDARGDDATNLTLSEKRAVNSVNYLISKGIKTERLKSKGMGEKEILNQCTNNITCSELEHALNRRTEFRFLKN